MTKTFKAHGLLWRLATVYGPLGAQYTLNYGTDICTYTSAVFKGLLMVLTAMVAGGFVGALFGSTTGYLLAILITGDWLLTPEPPAFAGIMVVASALVTLALMSMGSIIDRYRYGGAPTSDLHRMYAAWKSKFCHNVDFKD